MKNLTLSLLVFTLLVSMTFSGAEGRLKQFNSGESYTVDYILGVKNLSILYTGNDPQFDGDEYKVTGFQMVIAPKVGQAEYFEASQDFISDGIKSRIKSNLKSGDKILMDKISYIKHDGEIKIIGPIHFYIK